MSDAEVIATVANDLSVKQLKSILTMRGIRLPIDSAIAKHVYVNLFENLQETLKREAKKKKPAAKKPSKQQVTKQMKPVEREIEEEEENYTEIDHVEVQETVEFSAPIQENPRVQSSTKKSNQGFNFVGHVFAWMVFFLWLSISGYLVYFTFFERYHYLFACKDYLTPDCWSKIYSRVVQEVSKHL